MACSLGYESSCWRRLVVDRYSLCGVRYAVAPNSTAHCVLHTAHLSEETDSIQGPRPNLHPDAFVAPNATVLGRVTIAREASIWFGSVVAAGALIAEGTKVPAVVVRPVDE